ncbi:MAG: hypothetical protein IKN17_00515 [Ruminococcus sp.]|nr:hypothetical protein [Ruminococcus sp.]
MKKIMNRMPVNVRGESDHELLQFFLGFMMLGGGIYWAMNMFEVSWNWGWRIGSWNMTAGVMLVPLLVGIFLMFLLEKKAIGGAITALGVLIIIIAMINSVSFHARSASLWVYVLMFGMIFAGAGLVAKVLFQKKPRSKDNSDDQFKL